MLIDLNGWFVDYNGDIRNIFEPFEGCTINLEQRSNYICVVECDECSGKSIGEYVLWATKESIEFSIKQGEHK